MPSGASSEYRLRARLYRALGDGAPLPTCAACGAQTFIGDRYRHLKCADFTTGKGGAAVRGIDDRYARLAAPEPCGSAATPGSRYCKRHRRDHPDEDPLPQDEHGHTLRCSGSLVPPWTCPL